MRIRSRITAFIILETFIFSLFPLAALEPPKEIDIPAIVADESCVPEVFSGVVTPEEGAVLNLGNITLDIPAGAVNEKTEITVEKLSTIKPLNEGMANVTTGANGYRFSPHGIQFERNIKVTIPFDPAVAESESALSNLYTYFYDENLERWTRLTKYGVDKENHTITSLTNHFTDMVNSTLQMPDSPSPLDFNLNSIKDLEAMNPAAEIPQISGLEPDSFGAASFRIPLRIPQGRGAAMPQLALSYSSESTNSWMGRGFNISSSQISTDTRFGLPKYDGNDTYLLDGEELVYIGNNGSAMEYRQRSEKSFSQILRYRTAFSDYWEVTDKLGTTRVFGKNDAWIGPERSTGNQVYTWFLSKIKDINGNTVEYSYDYIAEDQNTYLRTIIYSGYEGTGAAEEGRYKIEFVPDSNTRPDRRIDARGKFPSKLTRRLKEVKVNYDSIPIRSYVFNYTHNEFQQTELTSYSEYDRFGNIFYTYDFEYNRLPVHDAGDGVIAYDAFGEAEEQWGSQDSEDFENLSKSITTSGGGSLYAGISLYIKFLWWKKIFAQFGVRGGVTFSQNMTKSKMLDVNGDGLLDAVWYDGNGLHAYLNRDGYFDSIPTDFGSLAGMMDAGSQDSFNIGLSAGLFGANAALTKQYSWSESETVFTDANGDGFVDQVKKGSSQYRRNDGTQFLPVNWENDSANSDAFESSDPEMEEAFDKTYFRQDPVRLWKAYRSGEIEMINSFSFENPLVASNDGVIGNIYKGNEKKASLTPKDPSSTPDIIEITPERGDRYYFHLDQGIDGRGDTVQWSTSLRYKSIKYLEDMDFVAEFKPIPTFTASAFPFDEALKPLYDETLEEGGPDYRYTLKSDWKSLSKGILLPAYNVLISKNRFVPRRIPEDLFIELFNQIPEDVITGDPYQDLPRLEEKLALLNQYFYVPEEQAFYAEGNSADSVVLSYMPESGASALWTESAKRAMAFYRWIDGTEIYPEGSTGNRYHSVSSSITNNPAIVFEYDIEAHVGATLSDKSILIDKIYPETLDIPVSSLFLRKNVDGLFYPVIRDNDGEEAINEYILNQTSDSISLSLNVDGCEHEFVLSGKNYLIEKLPASLYDGEVSNFVMTDKLYIYRNLYTIAVDDWDNLVRNLTVENKTFFESLYSESSDGQEFNLSGTIEHGDLWELTEIIEEVTDNSDSIFGKMSWDTAGTVSPLTISRESKDLLNNFLTENNLSSIDDYLDSVSEPGFSENIIYIVKDDLTLADQETLKNVIYRYRRDVEIFPYYDKAAGDYQLKSGLTDDDKQAVRDVMASCNINTWENLNRKMIYRSTADFETVTVLLPGGESETALASGSENLASPGDETSRIAFLTFDSLERTRVSYKYVHIFNTNNDFSSSNLVNYDSVNAVINKEPENASEIPEAYERYEGQSISLDPEVFSGGVRGWFYGVWIGNYEWNEANLGKVPDGYNGIPEEPENPEEVNGKVTPPPYYEPVVRNQDESGNQILSTSGDSIKNNVPADSWIGAVSTYSKTNLDLHGNANLTEYNFAPFINRDVMHPQRRGGEAYYNVPKEESALSDGSLKLISASRNISTDINGGINLGYAGVNFSKNSGKGWGYGEYIDLNGDRYPDVLQFPQGRGNSFTFIPGTETGFATPLTGTSGFTASSEYRNLGLGYGASVGSSGGGMNAEFSDSGKLESLAIVAPDTDSKSSPLSGGVAINGTLGESIQSLGFRDINGDGLPDHISRSGSGDYNVWLNQGDLDFQRISLTWSNPMDTTVQPVTFGKLQSKASGLSHSDTGSYGASGNLGILNAGISAGFNANANRTHSMLMDINGDGLTDQVTKRNGDPYFLVRFNLGDNFSDQTVRLYRPEWTVDLGNDLANVISQDLQMIYSQLDSLGTPGNWGRPGFVSLPDNGDNHFGTAINPLVIDDTLNYSTGIGINLGANITFNFSFWLIALTITPGGNGSYASTSATLQMTDINGDGLPDHVLKMPGYPYVHVKRNDMGKVGLIKSISIPTGGTYDLEYERVGNTVNLPQSKYILSSVIKNDGFDNSVDSGEHSYTDLFMYSDGYYDRIERQFFGFGQVETKKADGSVITQQYANRDYFTKGLLTLSKAEDETGRLFRMSERTYSTELMALAVLGENDSYFTGVDEESETVFDPVYGDSFTTLTKYEEYDNYGNVKRLVEYGVLDSFEETPGDDLILEIDYFNSSSPYLHQHPATLRVSGGDGSLLRYRKGSYYAETGKIKTLKQFDTGQSSAEYSITYDKYGNLLALTDPRGFSLAYEYDDDVETYITRTTSSNTLMNAPSYSSSAVWDVKLGKETSSIDMNGNLQTKAYDSLGRLLEIRTPYDTGSVSVLAYTYNTSVFPQNAVTANKLRFDPADTEVMDTVVTIDGLGRVIQTAKEGEVYTEDGPKYGWNRSGRIIYDAKARPVAEGQTSFEETCSMPTPADLIRPTIKTYDILDRVTQLKLPDNSLMQTSYGVEGTKHIIIATDPEGNVTETLKDFRNNISAIRKKDHTGKVLTSTSYRYNVLGEMLETLDHFGNPAAFSYDMLGRRTAVFSLDAGLIEYFYDESGNLVKKVDDNLRADETEILYEYDGLNRLVKTNYPYMTDVINIYGQPGASDNSAGRLIKRIDESGNVLYTYGKMGETTGMVRTLHRLTPLEADRSASFEYLSDYLGRMEEIVYPDGEVVSYGYDLGGQVTSVTGVKNGEETRYVERIGYDEYGQRVYIRYGNGTETAYTYDEDRRWLDSIKTVNGWSEDYQNISYDFDRIGNILKTENITDGYKAIQSYVYDDLYQLTKATGQFAYKPDIETDYTNHYSQTFEFDEIGNMISKYSTQVISPRQPAAMDLNYNLNYRYYGERAHQAESIGDIWYRYDGNGNVVEERQGGLSDDDEWNYIHPGRGRARALGHNEKAVPYGIGIKKNNVNGNAEYHRVYYWDEENRLKRSEDATNTVEYIYGADGQRSSKYTKHNETLYFDSMWMLTTDHPTFRQSKHIYLGETRIATRMKIEGDDTHGYVRINTYYYHPDHLGSANIITDYEGGVYEHIEYTPYGELWEEQKSDVFDRIPFRFTGKILDTETALYYYGARYLDPRTSRWISPDPMMDGLNWYGYVSNNPLKLVDPTGLAEVYADDIHGNAILAWEGRDLKKATSVEFERSASAGDSNDIARIKIGSQTFAEYEGVQSEKNYASGAQTEAERHDPDLSNPDYPNVTLPTGDDYQLTLLSGDGSSYDKPMIITSDSVQIPGLTTKGIKKAWAFLAHKISKKNKPYTEAYSWGCQIFNDKAYNSFRGNLEGIGFNNRDKVPMSITQISASPLNNTRNMSGF